ncbi:anthrone oxygenase family protein [Bradyrhizobium sp. B124]|uniref:anthrone oxygenase family protein n=1 Tax=Bradyrhizobium sp. B124 TaxID=3140245 RepID=UPI0031834D65
MRNVLTSGLLWFSALGCGLLAGVYFTFSAFVMTALGRIDQAAGVSAMNAINVDIVRSLFMPVFLGTTLSCAGLVVLGGLRWQEPGALAMICGGGLYVVGMFVVTVVFNVPLNDQLAATDPASTAAAPVWAHYLTDWTFWNHARTIASLAATALLIAAIAAR